MVLIFSPTRSRVCFWLVVAAVIVGLAGEARGQTTAYTDEAAYLAAAAALPGSPGSILEGFEDAAVWGTVRSVGATINAAPRITSQGITWESNQAPNKITTSTGPARSGFWAVFSHPHGDQNVPQPTDFMHDGFILSSGATLYGVGGWYKGTPGGSIVAILDGDEANPVGPPVPNLLGPVHVFFGVIRTTGFTSFEIREREGTKQDQKLVFADDFVIVTPASANRVPVAAGDSYAVAEDAVLGVAAPGPLANDVDADGDPLTTTLVSGPVSGLLLLNADGSFTYTPDTDFNGEDSFTYRANDGTAASNTATVTIAVSPVNDAPVAAADAYGTAEDTPLVVAAPGVLGNDSDADGDPLAAVRLTGPAHGTLTLGADGSFTYTPAANFAGRDSFTYRANDGAADSGAATVTLTVSPVNHAPVAAADAYGTAEDTPLVVAAPGVLGNDSDADGDPLAAVKLTEPAHGTVALNANGSFSYTPAANYTGSDSFTYRANDGTAASNTATVTITVSPVNDAPVAAADAYGTAEDTPLVVAAPGVLGNDSDADGNPLTGVKLTDPLHGTVTLSADGSFTYTPAANYTGSDSFTYKANDGAADSGAATVTITVGPVNDAPAAAADAFGTIEDTPLVVAAPGVLGNDSDADGDTLTAVRLTDPAHGTLTFNSNGSFTYTPAANFTGPDSFTYKANDGAADSNAATVTIAVSPVNDAPVAAADAYGTAEDTILTVAAPGVLGNDADVDGNPLTAVKLTDPVHGTVSLNANGSFTYTPALNYAGPDSFTYRANDGAADSGAATVTLTVSPANHAPVAVADAYGTVEDTPLVVAAPGVLGNDSDADGDTLAAVRLTDPLHGTLALSGNGSFTYTPAANFTGQDFFTYRANDGAKDSGAAMVTITVSPVNHAPIAVADSYGTAEDTPLLVAAPGVLGNDTDANGDPLAAVRLTGPANGTLTVSADGSFTYTPAANFAGQDSFTYKANDGAADSGAATVTITVSPVNDAPAAAADAFGTVEDTPLVVAAPGVLGNDSDADGDTLAAVRLTDPAHGTLALGADGSFTYTPAANFTGQDSFTYKANDGAADSGIATVTITVNPVRLPVTDVRANGKILSTVQILPGEQLEIAVSLDCGDYCGSDADWWIWAQTPSGSIHYDGATDTWVAGLAPSYQQPLAAMPLTVVYRAPKLPKGTYDFSFEVDWPMDGTRDTASSFRDMVTVTVGGGFLEDFDDGVADRWLETPAASWTPVPGLYRARGKTQPQVLHARYDERFGDFVYGAEVRLVGGSADSLSHGMGLLFRADDAYRNGYVFEINARGHYLIFKRVGGRTVNLTPDWIASALIRRGRGVWNRLEVVCTGSSLAFKINGKVVKRITDTSLKRGKAGLKALGSAATGATFEFDNARLVIR